MSKLLSVICPSSNEILTNSWAAMSFKFQWQKVKDDCLGLRLIFMYHNNITRFQYLVKKVHEHLPLAESLSRNKM